MLPIADTLGTATWGLVIATALLVIANAIPAVNAALDRRRMQQQRIASLIPDLHILRSRLNGASRSYDDLHADGDEIELWIEDISGMLSLLAPLLDTGQEEGLELTNELYICRHLLTQAMYEYRDALAATAEEKRRAVDRGIRLLIAALLTVDAVEKLLPQRGIKIHGERFWDRFVRISEEREQAAEGRRRRDLGA